MIIIIRAHYFFFSFFPTFYLIVRVIASLDFLFNVILREFLFICWDPKYFMYSLCFPTQLPSNKMKGLISTSQPLGDRGSHPSPKWKKQPALAFFFRYFLVHTTFDHPYLTFNEGIILIWII